MPLCIHYSDDTSDVMTLQISLHLFNLLFHWKLDLWWYWPFWPFWHDSLLIPFSTRYSLSSIPHSFYLLPWENYILHDTVLTWNCSFSGITDRRYKYDTTMHWCGDWQRLKILKLQPWRSKPWLWKRVLTYSTVIMPYTIFMYFWLTKWYQRRNYLYVCIFTYVKQILFLEATYWYLYYDLVTWWNLPATDYAFYQAGNTAWWRAWLPAITADTALRYRLKTEGGKRRRNSAGPAYWRRRSAGVTRRREESGWLGENTGVLAEHGRRRNTLPLASYRRRAEECRGCKPGRPATCGTAASYQKHLRYDLYSDNHSNVDIIEAGWLDKYMMTVFWSMTIIIIQPEMTMSQYFLTLLT